MDFLSISTLITDRILNAQRQFPVPEDENFPLHCPVTSERLLVPSISLHCTHKERIELRIYLEFCFSQNYWGCPLCKILTPLKDIYIDLILYQALTETTANSKAIRVLKEGTWEIIEEETEKDIFSFVVSDRTNLKVGKANGSIDTYLTKNKHSHYRRNDSNKLITKATTRITLKNSLFFNQKAVYFFPSSEPDCYFYDFARFE